jgi:hypothetical protein
MPAMDQVAQNAPEKWALPWFQHEAREWVK